MIPARHLTEILRPGRPRRLPRIPRSRPPSPSLSEILGKVSFDQFHDVLADVGQQLERVPYEVSVSSVQVLED